MNKELLIHWGIVAFASLLAMLAAMYVGGMCSHIAAFNILWTIIRIRKL